MFVFFTSYFLLAIGFVTSSNDNLRFLFDNTPPKENMTQLWSTSDEQQNVNAPANWLCQCSKQLERAVPVQMDSIESKDIAVANKSFCPFFYTPMISKQCDKVRNTDKAEEQKNRESYYSTCNVEKRNQLLNLENGTQPNHQMNTEEQQAANDINLDESGSKSASVDPIHNISSSLLECLIEDNQGAEAVSTEKIDDLQLDSINILPCLNPTFNTSDDHNTTGTVPKTLNRNAPKPYLLSHSNTFEQVPCDKTFVPVNNHNQCPCIHSQCPNYVFDCAQQHSSQAQFQSVFIAPSLNPLHFVPPHMQYSPLHPHNLAMYNASNMYMLVPVKYMQGNYVIHSNFAPAMQPPIYPYTSEMQTLTVTPICHLLPVLKHSTRNNQTCVLANSNSSETIPDKSSK